MSKKRNYCKFYFSIYLIFPIKVLPRCIKIFHFLQNCSWQEGRWRASIWITTKLGGGSIGGQEIIFLVLIPASVCDLWRYRVPNVIVCTGLVLSLYKNLWTYGMVGLWYFTLNGLIPFVVCFFFYLFHLCGAGDIKLFSIISSYYDFKFCFRVMIVSLLFGAVFSVVKMIRRKNFICRFRYFSKYMKNLAAGRKPVPYYDLNTNGDEGVIPFTICISMAFIICMWNRF